MKNKWLTAILTCGLALGICTRLNADTFTFGTLPLSGDVAGWAGSTVGWGYIITNNSLTDWLVTTGVNADIFLNGTPDASIFD